ncbi:MAG: hypothetical protein ABJ251_10945 [Paracoccaceae bacterium]
MSFWSIVPKPQFEFSYDRGFVPAEPYYGKFYRGAGRHAFGYAHSHPKGWSWLTQTFEWNGIQVFEDIELSELTDLAYNSNYEEKCFLREFSGTVRAGEFGIEVISNIAGSLIGQALYQRIFDFEGLNENCLFCEPEQANLFIERYLYHAAKNEIEPPAGDSNPVLCVVGGANLLPETPDQEQA